MVIAPQDNNAFFVWDGDTLVLNILGTPGASRDAIGKPRGNQLKISVAAAPEQGKATEAMVKFLAGQFGVAPARIEVVFGQTSIHKQLRIPAPRKIPAALSAWLKVPA